MSKTAYQEMVESFSRLQYMIQTTAPHLQSLMNELHDRIEDTIKDSVPVLPPHHIHVPPPEEILPEIPPPPLVAPKKSKEKSSKELEKRGIPE